MRQADPVDQHLIGLCFLDRVQVLALDVLDDGKLEHLIVRDIFDDGWMIYAAHSFLERIHYLLPVAHLLKDAQMQAINEHCPGKLSEYPRDYYFLAQNLYSRLPVQLQQRFRQMTWELAGYPLSAENPSFHAGFVEGIRHHFKTRPDELMRKLAEYTNVDALFMQLPPP